MAVIKRRKIQISVSEDIVERLEPLCAERGLSKSAAFSLAAVELIKLWTSKEPFQQTMELV